MTQMKGSTSDSASMRKVDGSNLKKPFNDSGTLKSQFYGDQPLAISKSDTKNSNFDAAHFHLTRAGSNFRETLLGKEYFIINHFVLVKAYFVPSNTTRNPFFFTLPNSGGASA